MAMKYIGLDVLEYEKWRILTKLVDSEIEMDGVHDKDWYTKEEKQWRIELYEREISKCKSEMKEISDIIEKYSDGFYEEFSYSSTEPLQEYYKEEIDRLIEKFRKDLRKYYSCIYNTLMSAGLISINYFAKVGAKNVTLFYGIEKIVNDYLYREQIKEIGFLTVPKKEHIKAIEHKYDFFRNSLVDCFPLIQEVKQI